MKYAPYLCPDCYGRLIDTAAVTEPGDEANLSPMLECADGCGVSERALKPYRTRMNGRARSAGKAPVRSATRTPARRQQ
ncbi:hypothetical protein SAMN04489751_3155 [Brevibacterium sandarakinum]|uniref:Uncharacterized protein n=1 Tax=Brevibacterium sandarakinum TaxID=629680 RepID=A0A1H1VVQ9_BRESA|nr:hypothetical protein SAMN04489751_3155 [Brevibacterium sandarakinum]